MNTVKTQKRIMAYLLDVLLVYFLISAIISIRFINPTYEKYIESYEKYVDVMNDYSKGKITTEQYTELNIKNIINVTKYSVSSNIVIVLVLIGYFCVFQYFNNGQTLGKKIMKIKVVSIDNKKINFSNYLLRILPVQYIFIGSVMPIILNSIFVFIFNINYYVIINSVTTYSLFFISIVSLFMIIKRDDKRGIQDIIAKTKVVEE